MASSTFGDPLPQTKSVKVRDVGKFAKDCEKKKKKLPIPPSYITTHCQLKILEPSIKAFFQTDSSFFLTP